jgi:hypothetical protein
VLRGNERHRLAEVAHAIEGQNRLIRELEAVQLRARDVLVGEDGVHPGHRERPGDVDLQDARVRERAAQRVAPEHPGRREVARVLELPRDLRHTVLARDDLADTP